ncbi:MAG: PEGA domain-containing protein, partial [Verrucomicrobia bacterium]|nr:PEGA domain-containing protein [Verrucomicrobiota bacterium]
MRTRPSLANRLSLPLTALCFIVATSSPTSGQETLAQIHVSSDPPQASVTLDGVSQGITPTTLTGVAPGDHLLIINKNGYREARRTLALSAGERSAVEIKLEQETGLVLIDSEPHEIAVQIDQAERGQTPLLLADLPLGRYRLRLSRPGYIAKEHDLVIKDRTPIKLMITMQSNTAELTVTSDPAGASVTLNGIDQGTTPTTIPRVNPGANALRVTLDGFAPFDHTLKLEPGQKETLAATLMPLPARLQVVSIPSEARVYINNQFRGTSPVTLDDLAPGEYRVRVEQDGYDVAARTLTIERAMDLVEEFRLASNSGTIEIITVPAGVNIFIDGKPRGATSAQTNQTDQVSDPITIQLSAGTDHEVQLSKPGFYSKKIPISLERDQTVAIHEKLARRFIPDYEITTPAGKDTGVLLEVDPDGNVRLETRPGIIKTIPAADVITGRPLR